MSNILDSLSLEELKSLKETIEQFESKQDIIDQINTIIHRRTGSLNDRFLIKNITTFTPQEREILERNNIESIGDLRRIKVRELAGITRSTEESIGWAREFYNLEPESTPAPVKKRGKK